MRYIKSFPYFKIVNGILIDENNHKLLVSAITGVKTPHFNSIDEAEQWLTDNDVRGQITSAISF